MDTKKKQRKPPLKSFIVYYDGLWMGGKAVVRARDEEEAKQLVKEDRRTISFKDVVVEQVGANEHVIYNDNGDY